MKIHVMSVGFTPKVFEDSLKTAVKTGADRAIVIHSKDRSEREKVRETIENIKSWMSTREEFITDEPFEKAVRECIRILNSTGRDDELYIHIGGGERHIALALLYATFFVKRKMHLLVTIRKAGKFKTEPLPPISAPFVLSSAQKKVLEAVKQDRKLKEIVDDLKGERKDYPRIFRHLNNLESMGFVSFNQDEKKYSQTFWGRLLLEGYK
jgi:CRISPR locus-related DNA-binding protein